MNTSSALELHVHADLLSSSAPYRIRFAGSRSLVVSAVALFISLQVAHGVFESAVPWLLLVPFQGWVQTVWERPVVFWLINIGDFLLTTKIRVLEGDSCFELVGTENETY